MTTDEHRKTLTEYRRYEVAPGKMDVVRRYVQDVSGPNFARHGFQLVGPWETVFGTTNTLHYMLEWDDLTQRETAWAAFYADEQYQEERRQAFAEGEAALRAHVQLWKPLGAS